MRSKWYLIITSFLFFFFAFIYLITIVYFDGTEWDKRKIEYLSKQIQEIQFQNEVNTLSYATKSSDDQIELGQKSKHQFGVDTFKSEKLSKTEMINKSRNIASIENVRMQNQKLQDSSFLTSYYFLRYESFKNLKQLDNAEAALLKIKDLSPHEEVLAKVNYLLLDLTCYEQKLADHCVNLVDQSVSLFPFSEWTGKSLVWLQNAYEKNNKIHEKSILKQIVENNFQDVLTNDKKDRKSKRSENSDFKGPSL